MSVLFSPAEKSFYDLKRLNKLLKRNGANQDVSVAALHSIPAGDIRWEFLIPQDEINNSNGMVKQNPL